MNQCKTQNAYLKIAHRFYGCILIDLMKTGSIHLYVYINSMPFIAYVKLKWNKNTILFQCTDQQH